MITIYVDAGAIGRGEPAIVVTDENQTTRHREVEILGPAKVIQRPGGQPRVYVECAGVITS